MFVWYSFNFLQKNIKINWTNRKPYPEIFPSSPELYADIIIFANSTDNIVKLSWIKAPNKISNKGHLFARNIILSNKKKFADYICKHLLSLLKIKLGKKLEELES